MFSALLGNTFIVDYPYRNAVEFIDFFFSRLVTGTKVLVLKETLLHPASITSVDNNYFTLNFR